MNDKPWPRPARLLVIPLVVAAGLAAMAVTAILRTGSGTTALNPLGEHFVADLTYGEPDSPITIVSTSTGAKVSYVNPLSHQVDFTAAGTGDGVNYVTSLDRNNGCRSRLYRFTLNSDGTPGPLASFGSLLPVRILQLAVSADGHTIAYMAQRCTAAPGSARTIVGVIKVTTGQQHQWPAGGRQVSFFPMSLTADGSTLVFTADQLHGVSSAVYLLDTTAPPGPLALRSRILVKPGDLPHTIDFTESMITPSSRTVYFTSGALWAMNVSTQRARLIARVLSTRSITADPSVRRAIGVIETATQRFRAVMVDLRTGKMIRLPRTFSIPDTGSYIW